MSQIECDKMKTTEYGVVQGGEERYSVLRDLVRKFNPGPARVMHVLEVGSYEGASALVWSGAIAQFCAGGGRVLCIDPWSEDYLQPFITRPIYNQMASDFRDGTVFRRFQHNVSLANPKVPIDWFRGTFKSYCEVFLPRKFDIIYLDGNHSYSALAEDIALVKDWVVDGGLLVGDDLEQQLDTCSSPESARACADTEDYINGYHPGVTVAVWEAFGRVWSKSGTWAMQKVNTTTWQPPAGV